MTAKIKKEKKVMEEKRPSLPEVVTVRKRPRTPGVTLNRLIEGLTPGYTYVYIHFFFFLPEPLYHFP